MNWQRVLILVLIGVLGFFGLTYIYLWLDSSGMYAYIHDQWTLQGYEQAHPTGYVYTDGVYDLQVYSATVENGTRLVPASVTDADCTIAFVGDSVTWGLGVDDAETFVNLLTAELQVRALNTGRIGYNTQQAMWLIDHYEADGYVYLHIDNDNEPVRLHNRPRLQHPPSRLDTWLWWQQQVRRSQRATRESGEISESDPEREMMTAARDAVYRATLQTLAQRETVLAFSFSSNRLIKIPHYTSVVSKADPHPDAAGHAEIAASMLPYVRDWLPQICENHSSLG